VERYLVGSNPTTSTTFQEDGVTVDPGTVTLTLTREDGTVIASGQSTGGTGAAARTFNLTAATHLTVLDLLRLDWTSATKGVQTSYVEVVGGFLFTLASLRALNPFTVNGTPNTTTYPTADLITARTLAEDALEHACGVAFVPRYFRTKVDGSGGADVLLPPRPLTVTSVIVGASSASAGTTLTADELADLELYDDGRVYNPTGWAQGRHNVEIKGSHGYVTPPARVGRAARLLAKRWLVDTPMSDRATSIRNDDGSMQFFVTAGVRDMLFDVPECNVIVDDYGLNSGIA
jgi:hypothetical protein